MRLFSRGRFENGVQLNLEPGGAGLAGKGSTVFEGVATPSVLAEPRLEANSPQPVHETSERSPARGFVMITRRKESCHETYRFDVCIPGIRPDPGSCSEG